MSGCLSVLTDKDARTPVSVVDADEGGAVVTVEGGQEAVHVLHRRAAQRVLSVSIMVKVNLVETGPTDRANSQRAAALTISSATEAPR